MGHIATIIKAALDDLGLADGKVGKLFTSGRGALWVAVDGLPALVAGAIPTKAAGRVARVAYMATVAAPTTLPGSSAYTTANTPYSIPDGVQFVKFYLTYVSATALGAVKCKVQVGNGSESTAYEVTVDPTITVTQPVGAQLAYVSEISGPVPGSGNTAVFALCYAVRAGETTITMQVADVTATPGTCAIGLTAGY